jgi:hypothetical protein
MQTARVFVPDLFLVRKIGADSMLGDGESLRSSSWRALAWLNVRLQMQSPTKTRVTHAETAICSPGTR